MRNFSKTHRQTQRIYFWIGLDLTEVGKLLRSKTNSQIGARGKPSTFVYRAG